MAHLRGLTEQERKFVSEYVDGGNITAAEKTAGYADNSGYALLRRAEVALAVRAEVMRRLATEGAQVGFRALREIARSDKAPAAARVAASKALLSGAGILDNPTKPQGETKALNEMTREELDDAIRKYERELDTIEGELAARAKPVNASLNTPVSPPGPKKLNDMLD